jgi:alcohol dehydrogenase
MSSAIPRHTRAWRLPKPGAALTLTTIETPQPHAGSVVVRMEATPLLSYFSTYAAGNLPYWYPNDAFTPGTNGVGVIAALGADVHHLRPGQRVFVHPHLVANEIVDEPAQILIGLTGISADSGQMLEAWRNGTLAEHVLMPASTVVPLEGLAASSERLASLGKFAVPLGGLLRGRLTQGETVVVNGATGYFGSAAVLLSVALGAERVVALGRSAEALADVARVAGPRVSSVVLSGNIDADVEAVRATAGPRGPHLAFDQVGAATDANATLTALRSLRRGGRLVLMGSMSAPLPIDYRLFMQNDWELIGNFMYRPAAFRTLVSLVRGGLLDLEAVRIKSFPFADLSAAADAAAAMRGLDCTVIRMHAAGDLR